MTSFTDSNEHAYRKLLRDAVRKCKDFSRAEKDVITTIVNLWVHHRNGPEGVIRPGRQQLARRARVSEATVKRVLSLLRSAEAITARAYAKGGRKATRYKLHFEAFLELCGKALPDWAQGNLEEVSKEPREPEKTGSSEPENDPVSEPKNRVMVTHGSYDVTYGFNGSHRSKHSVASDVREMERSWPDPDRQNALPADDRPVGRWLPCAVRPFEMLRKLVEAPHGI